MPQGQWSFQLARFLQGQALDVYQRMTDEDVGDYELLKNSLLKRGSKVQTQVQPHVVKRSLVEAEQMTGTHELCMLIDGVVKKISNSNGDKCSAVAEMGDRLATIDMDRSGEG